METQPSLPFNTLSMKYILIPKYLLKQQLDALATPRSELEGRLTRLTAVNFKETHCTIDGCQFVCGCGESLHSRLFGWTHGKTRHYLNKL